MLLCPSSVCTIVIGELVNVTQQQLHRIPAMPSAATVDDAGPSDSTSDLMVKKFFRDAGVSALCGADC